MLRVRVSEARHRLGSAAPSAPSASPSCTPAPSAGNDTPSAPAGPEERHQRARPLDGNDQDAGHRECLVPPRPQRRQGQPRCEDSGEPSGANNPLFWRPARWHMPEGEEDPTIWAPDHEPYDTGPRGRLPLFREVPDSSDLSSMNIENYRAVTLALPACIPVAFAWLVGDAESAIEILRGTHGHDRGDLSRRSGDLRPSNAIERLVAAWMTLRLIPVPRWLQPVVQWAHQPPVPRSQPDTYGNVAVARVAQNVAASAWFSSHTPSRPGKSNPSKIPYRYRHPSSSGASIRAKPQPRDTSRDTGAPGPSKANPPSPREDGAAKQAAGRYLSPPQRHPDSGSAPQAGRTHREPA